MEQKKITKIEWQPMLGTHHTGTRNFKITIDCGSRPQGIPLTNTRNRLLTFINAFIQSRLGGTPAQAILQETGVILMPNSCLPPSATMSPTLVCVERKSKKKHVQLLMVISGYLPTIDSIHTVTQYFLELFDEWDQNEF